MEPLLKTDNEVIAEFMGFRRQEVGEYSKVSYWRPAKDKRKRGDFVGYFDTMKFDESWNHLMEVIDFLTEPVVKDGIIIRSAVDIQIFYKACKLTFEPDEDFEDIDEFETQTQGETKLEAVYKAVLEFIKFYNGNK